MARLFFFPFIFIICFLVGCSPHNKRADLVAINGVEPETLDPALFIGEADQRVISELFEGLTRFNRAGLPEPGMASSWEISPDRCTYLFHLRPGVCWSDGRPLTADDFVKSWERTLKPETASAYSYQLFCLQGAEEFASGKDPDFSHVGVCAIDAATLKVTLSRPVPYFLQLCAFPTYFPVPVDLIERLGDDWIKPEHILCNAGYTLAAWRINDKITLKKNPLYWDAKNVALEKIDMLPISQANVAYNFYASGEADLLLDKALAPPSLLDELRKRDDFHAFPFLGDYFLRFNCSKGPFADVRVRKAFALCLNRKNITEKIARAGELPAESMVPPGIPGYEPAHGLGYNPELARHLLAEAGYPGGKGFPLTTYLYNEGELNEGIAVELQAVWQRELGVSILLARQEWKVYLNSLTTMDYGIARSSWVGDYADPNTFLDMFVTEGGNNRTGWSSKQYDQLIQEAANAFDSTKRFQIFFQAEELLLCEGVPVAPLYFYVGVQIYDPQKWGGIEGNVLDKHPLWQIYKK